MNSRMTQQSHRRLRLLPTFRQLLLVTMVIFVPVLTLASEPTKANQVRAQGIVKDAIVRYVTTILVEPNSVSVLTSKDIEGVRPKCATNINILVIDPSSAVGRAALATILSAAAEEKKIDLYGTGACNDKVKADAEELEAVVVKYQD